MVVTYEQIVAKIHDKYERVHMMCANCFHHREGHEKFVYPDRMLTDYKKCGHCTCKEFKMASVNALDLVEWIESECKKAGVKLEDSKTTT